MTAGVFYPDGHCHCAACRGATGSVSTLIRHTGKLCPYCSSLVDEKLDGEPWCPTCQRWL